MIDSDPPVPGDLEPTETRPADSGDGAPLPAEAPTGEFDPSRSETIVGDLSEVLEGSDRPTTRSLGEYVLERELARGGMGVVHLARDTSLNRRVAVKLLLDRYEANGMIAARFVEEAQITGQLQHPAIPPVHQVGTLDDGRPFLVMKLIKGTTLAQLLKERESLDEDLGRFVGIFEQVCQAVGYAHAHDVIHRDLKPSNVMVGAFGEVQVMDWGLAKVLGVDEPTAFESPTEPESPVSVIESGRDGSSMTQAGTLLGTPAYMPPEQAKGEIARTDRQADVFALGAMLCEILTGKPAYSAKSATELHALAVTAQLGPAFERLDGCSADTDLVALAKRCLSPDPAERPAEAGKVATAVNDYLAEAEERARQAELDRVRMEGERAKTVAEANERRKRRRVQIALGAAVIGLLVVAGVGIAIGSFWRKAVDARNTAETALAATEKAREDAETARAEAVSARDDAEAAREELALVDYGRTIQVALQRTQEGNVKEAQQLLEETRPDLRGWEYRYVDRLCHPEVLSIPVFLGACGQYSPDGTMIALGSAASRSTLIVDARTGAEIRRLGDHVVPSPEQWKPGKDNFGYHHVAWSPDGKRLVSGSPLRMWDVGSGEEVTGFFGGEVECRSIDWSADGRWIVSTGDPAIVWDAKTGERVAELPFEAGLAAAKFDHASRRLAVLTAFDPTARKRPDSKILVLDAGTWTETTRIQGNHVGANNVEFSPDDRQLLMGSIRGTTIWNLDDSTVERTLQTPLNTFRASYSPDGSKVATGGANEVALFDTETGVKLRAFPVSGMPYQPVFSPDGRRVLCSTNDGFRVWDATTDPEQTRIPHTPESIRANDFSADGRLLLTVELGALVRVWDTRTREVVAEYVLAAPEDQPESIQPESDYQVTFDRRAERVLCMHKSGVVELRETMTGRVLRSFQHGEKASWAKLSADEDRLITRHVKSVFDKMDGPDTTKLWNVETGELLATWDHEHAIGMDPFSPDGRLFATSEMGAVVLYSADEGEEVLRIDTPEVRVSPVFSPDGTRLVLTYTTGERPEDRRPLPGDLTYHVDVFDVRTGEELFTLEDEQNTSLSFTPDGTLIRGRSGDGGVRYVEVETGEEVFKLKGLRTLVGSPTAVFSPDGSRILTSSGFANNEIKLWDTATGTETLTLSKEDADSSIRFSSDGSRILAVGLKGGVIWDSRRMSESVREPTGETSSK